MPWRQNERELEKARAQIEQGSFSGAVDSLKRVLGQDPENDMAYALLGISRLSQGRIADAGQAISTALAIEGDVGFYHWVHGQVALARMDWTNAERAFQLAIDLNPEAPEGYHGLGLLNKLRGQRAEALSWLDKALTADPEHNDSLALAGTIALQEGNLDRAYEVADRALRIDPQHLGGCLVMGEVLCRRGDTEAAAEHAIMALQQSPDHDGALELLALIRARRNPLFLLWWRGEEAIKRLGPVFRVIVVLGSLLIFLVATDLLDAAGKEAWKYALAALVFPIGIYFALGHMALTAMIEREKRKIRLSSSF